MNQERLADLVGFRAAYALVKREEGSGWFNQELRADFEANIDKFDQWYGFIRKVIEEHGEIKEGFEPGKYQQGSPEAKLLKFTKACFKTFHGLRGQSLPVSVKYPRGDQLGVTTYDLSTTLRNYDIVDVEDDDILVLGPSDDDILSTVTARLPAYETEPTQYDQSTAEIEELLQTKIHRRIDQAELDDEFEVSTELLHRFFRIIRIVNAIIPSRITTSEYDIEVDNDASGPPEIDVHPRQI
jgi:CRISPR-associated endonuclease/helicase Cas3